MIRETKLVFSDYKYLVTAITIGTLMFISLLFLSEFLFVEPYIVLNISNEGVFRLILILSLSTVTGLVMPMNIYRVKNLRHNSKKTIPSIIGSIIGSSAGACECGTIGFSIISALGTIGGITTAFLSNYEIPIRLAALGIMGLSYFTTSNAILKECKIADNNIRN